MNTTTPQFPAPCAACVQAPGGQHGHSELDFYVEGPFPGQQIYKCAICSDRWIRHYGGEVGAFAWTRFAERFPSAIRRPMPVRTRPVNLPF